MKTNWTDGWRERAYSMVKDHGCASITCFLSRRPNTSFEDIASELGSDEIPPIQLQWLYRDEAAKGGQIKDYMASSFVRYLARHVPNGIRKHGDWSLTLALGSWAGSMDEEFQKQSAMIVKRFKDVSLELPDDWMPKCEDVAIRKIFDVLDDAGQLNNNGQHHG